MFYFSVMLPLIKTQNTRIVEAYYRLYFRFLLVYLVDLLIFLVIYYFLLSSFFFLFPFFFFFYYIYRYIYILRLLVEYSLIYSDTIYKTDSYHGLIAQLVRASEQDSVILGSNPTQVNFL